MLELNYRQPEDGFLGLEAQDAGEMSGAWSCLAHRPVVCLRG